MTLENNVELTDEGRGVLLLKSNGKMIIREVLSGNVRSERDGPYFFGRVQDGIFLFRDGFDALDALALRCFGSIILILSGEVFRAILIR